MRKWIAGIWNSLAAWIFRKKLESLIEEFERDFPDGCVICSFHEYGIRSGYVSGEEPVPTHYRCPEKLRRWQVKA